MKFKLQNLKYQINIQIQLVKFNRHSRVYTGPCASESGGLYRFPFSRE